MHRYIIMGPQGSGKGAQARLLAKHLSLTHISMGEILRGHLSGGTELGARIERSMSAGQLIDDALVNEVLRERLNRVDWQSGYILDGFPRTRTQAEFFLGSYCADAVILLEVEDNVVVARALNRRLCADCGADFNLASRPPKVDGVCDDCGGKLVSRDDDTPAAIHRRLGQYRRETEPIIDVLKRTTPIVRIDASGSIEEGQVQIARALNLPQT